MSGLKSKMPYRTLAGPINNKQMDKKEYLIQKTLSIPQNEWVYGGASSHEGHLFTEHFFNVKNESLHISTYGYVYIGSFPSDRTFEKVLKSRRIKKYAKVLLKEYRKQSYWQKQSQSNTRLEQMLDSILAARKW